MSHTKILLTGVTGYIGGSVLTQLRSSVDPHIKQCLITALVRDQEKAKVLAKHGVETLLFNGLDDATQLKDYASRFDIVINCATGMHDKAAEALILGLGESMKSSGKQAHYFHLTGTTNVANMLGPDSQGDFESLKDTDDVMGLILKKNEELDYIQRRGDIIANETAAKTGVKAYLLMPPTVIGEGAGLFNTTSTLFSYLLPRFREVGHPEYLHSDVSTLGWVHVLDLAALYEVLLASILTGGNNMPPTGHYFVSTSDYAWKEFAQAAGDIGVRLGALKSASPVLITFEESMDAWSFIKVDRTMLELAYGSRADTTPVKGPKLGWKPQRASQEDWEKEIEEFWKGLLAN